MSTVKISEYTGNINGLSGSLDHLSVDGNILISGSLIPNVGTGEVISSFSLGSPSAAWGEIYVSTGTINFLDGNGNTVGSFGAGSNYTIVTGSFIVVPAGDEEEILTSFSGSFTQFERSRNNDASLFIQSGALSAPFRLVANGDFNPALYNVTNTPSFYVRVLPWDKTIKNYFLKNNIYGAGGDNEPRYISLPPVINAGYSAGDIISIYNFTSGSGATLEKVNQTGSFYITSIGQGVNAVNTSTKLITSIHNPSMGILSGSWDAYSLVEYSDLNKSIKLNPGQKATFEVIVWGTFTTNGTTPANNTVINYGYPINGYAHNSAQIGNPGANVFDAPYGYMYLFRGIENL